MNNQKVEKWLIKRGIQLDVSFIDSLKNYAKIYKHSNGIKNLDDVYAKIGLKKQYIAYWSKNSYSVQTKNFQTQYYTICR